MCYYDSEYKKPSLIERCGDKYTYYNIWDDGFVEQTIHYTNTKQLNTPMMVKLLIPYNNIVYDANIVINGCLCGRKQGELVITNKETNKLYFIVTKYEFIEPQIELFLHTWGYNK